MTDTLFNIEENITMMPSEYKGRVTGACGYTESSPREWTPQELEWLSTLKLEGHSIAYIARSMGRTETSVRIKLKRLGKADGKSYNREHRIDKYNANAEFLDIVKPQTVLDLYAGRSSWYEGKCQSVVPNDEDKSFGTTYHDKAERLIHKLYYDRCRFDLVDLDPFGSAYDCLDLAIKMANKGMVVTYGEMGHRLFKRLDFVRRYYGIEAIEDFTTARLISETQRIASRSKKTLTPVIIKEWSRISRVYYLIGDMKITEQWNVLD